MHLGASHVNGIFFPVFLSFCISACCLALAVRAFELESEFEIEFEFDFDSDLLFESALFVASFLFFSFSRRLCSFFFFFL